MNALRTVLASCVVLAAVAVGGRPINGAEDTDANKQKIVGTWEMVKSSEKSGLPPGSTVEFTKDGKMKIKAKVQDKELVVEGKYSIEGDKLVSSATGADGKEQKDTDTITKLTDKELVLKGSKGEVTEFKKK
jgi:uncharacterized protein (TIGR03066 family)